MGWILMLKFSWFQTMKRTVFVFWVAVFLLAPAGLHPVIGEEQTPGSSTSVQETKPGDNKTPGVASIPTLGSALMPKPTDFELSLQKAVPAPTLPEVVKQPWPIPKFIRGIYATGWMAGSTKWFPRLVEFVDETEVNAMVIDVKDDTGTLSYESEVPLTQEIGANVKKIRDVRKMLQTLKDHKIYPIARIVVFKDPFLSAKKPEWAVKDSQTGGAWMDRKGLTWVDPNNREVWDYIIDISREAINLGFQEIQFDYVRFTSDGDLKRCVYPFGTGKIRADVIREFLLYTREKLGHTGVPISADIFGLSTSVPDDVGIGQQFEKIAGAVDLVCPMVYPSHYANGSFGLRVPDLHPYETVFRSVSDARKRLEQAGLTETKVRPWLQDFSLGNYYGRAQIQAQIKAVTEAGVKEWLFWNPSCRYDLGKY